MVFQGLIFSILTAFILIQQCSCYIIDDACTASQRDMIIRAVDEALAVGEYAAWRINDDHDRVAELEAQLIGSDPRAKPFFTNRMRNLRETVGTLHADSFTGPESRDKDKTVLFRCGERAVLPSPTEPNDRWYDRDFWDEFKTEPWGRKASGGNPPIAICLTTDDFGLTADTAQGYDDVDKKYPHHIIYLCPVVFDRNYVEPLVGDLWRENEWEGESFVVTTNFLTAIILHELLHAQSGQAYRPLLLGTLPSGAKEVYGYDEIKQLSDSDKMENTESHTMLAMVLWLKYNEIYAARGVIGPEFADPDDIPGDSPNDRHP